ncbi:hypothetical protein J5N97_026823 [Dioscorea zingiberensis]|uniref:RING-type domain-containing protein n=1 Tax=Dioscorea zingiberensis TaxID=325984 RepID=A0A9D5H743_9LILI|nr:hypothetical protein J5N97_026823 [Dioscorea zingiberensis]
MAAALALFFLFAGVAAIILLHLLVAGRAFHRRPRPSPPSPSPGLSPKDLKLLPCLKYSCSSAGSSDCAVCLEVLRDGDRVRVLPGCGHGFHAQCVDKWLVRTPACPICRGPIGSSGVARPRRKVLQLQCHGESSRIDQEEKVPWSCDLCFAVS